ncbi:IS3 family transposase [Micromonospora sp. CB01531]|uniref:IS3 family transposase n=1 Tax=Micromonospora sp. CB01531 TaxID=1718947 RepID=UPI0023791CA5|nr:IS3 family transposase [Micromonospora sp. CB01531]
MENASRSPGRTPRIDPTSRCCNDPLNLRTTRPSASRNACRTTGSCRRWAPSATRSLNALMENFWSTLKIELVYRTSWRTRDEAENAIFAYIDGWYNTRRIQKELGYLSPDEYETAWHTRQHDLAEPTIATPAPAGSR